MQLMVGRMLWPLGPWACIVYSSRLPEKGCRFTSISTGGHVVVGVSNWYRVRAWGAMYPNWPWPSRRWVTELPREATRE